MISFNKVKMVCTLLRIVKRQNKKMLHPVSVTQRPPFIDVLIHSKPLDVRGSIRECAPVHNRTLSQSQFSAPPPSSELGKVQAHSFLSLPADPWLSGGMGSARIWPET